MNGTLTSTQIGAIGESVIANALLVGSAGELSPFRPVADDDGVDLLVYKKSNGVAMPVQVKTRTVTLKKKGSAERGNTVHFEIALDRLKPWRPGIAVLVLLAAELTHLECAWVIPLSRVVTVAGGHKTKAVMRPSRAATSGDMYQQYRCRSAAELCDKIERELAMQR